ncbi:MFS transporter [Piscibacillus halophilus]|uniref:Predicted arabinose efflux permease, MFS family n=1 Tax=Piscibacillus halophilus TaxID=571933 RepID=A0A1H9CHX7_9BACI|nr:MFS transporter [Piscibacillus halophilus]SEQ00782.1 Predicted arabinose efflux permease, MFS family [Piscibacillus halophilus]
MERNHEFKVTVIALITAACILGDAMLFIVMPIYWQEFGLTALWQVGVLLSVNRLIRLPVNPLVGWFYKHIDKRTGVVLAIILATLSTLSYGWLQGFVMLLVMRCIWGIAWSFLRLGGFLTVMEVADDQSRGRLMGKYNGLWGLGGLTGMLAGGLLADVTNLKVVATLFGLLSILSLPIAFKYIPKTKEMETPSTSPHTKESNMWKNCQAWSVLSTGFIMAMVIFGIFLSTLSRLIDFQLDQEWTFLGFAIGVGTIAGLIQAVKWAWDPFLAPIAGRLSDEQFGRVKMLVFAFVGSGMAFYFLTKDLYFIWIIGLILVFQLMSTILVTVTDSLASDVATTTSKVGLMTAYTVAVDLGAAVGPLIGYVVLDLISLEVLYQLTSVILILIGFYWMVKGRKASR